MRRDIFKEFEKTMSQGKGLWYNLGTERERKEDDKKERNAQ